jgi:hypothetical protein
MRDENTILTAIVAIIAMDIISDIMFLTAMLNSTECVDEQDNEPSYLDTHPLVGRRYVPKTSDYATDRATGVRVDNLHGKEYIIVGNPFVKDGHLMVTIFSTDSEREYDVLFQENCIVEED